MSRKLTHYGQNDISLTGNAPGILRLNNRIDVEKGLSKQNSRAVKGEKNLSIDEKDRLHGNSVRERQTVIPGLIRLNGCERERLTNGQRQKTKDYKVPGIDAHKVSSRVKNVLHEDEIIWREHPLSLSPARSFASKKYPIWFDDVQIKESSLELHQLYDTLIGIIQQNAVPQHWAYLMETQKQLQDHFKNIVLQHLKLCCEMKCDNFFWKLLYYNIREYLIYAKDIRNNDCLLELIDDGIAFYKDLIGCIKIKYLPIVKKSQKSEKFEFIAKFVAQKLLICLGDLYRYKAKQLQSNDFNEAAKCYREAQTLIPTNGIPYNQLAIVALHDRKKFEAVYLHMRSLMSSNAIQSARESLLVLFDEMRKKFESTEQKVSPVHQYKNTNATNSSSKLISPLRKEVWIHPDGVRRLHRTNLRSREKLSKPAKNIELRLDEMPVEDLIRRFISIYLYVIGKLYTGIGMETIQAHQIKLLTQLNVLLQKEGIPLPITRSKVLKIVALNIFILHYNMQQDSRREIRYYTFTFCNQIFGVLLQKCNQILSNLRATEALRKDDEPEELRDLNTFLQFIKIYTDYLGLNVEIWEPIRNDEQYFIDPWIELQTLFEHIEYILIEYKSDFEDIDQQEREFVLEENYFFYGFMALPTIQSKRFLTKRYSSELPQFFSRLEHIKEFQLCYTEHMDRLQIDENDGDLSFVLEDLNTEIKTALEILNNETEIEQTAGVELENKTSACLPGNKSLSDLKSIQEGNGGNGDALAQLSKLKKELEHQTNAKRLYNDKLEGILKYVDTKVYIEVRPKYLLPDTNCFIDCLDDFEKLLQNFKRYTLVIPLTVVRELDGLSKGIKSELRPHSMQKHRIHHFDDVSTMAKKSLDFIKNAKQNVKCVTTKGSIINASLFALVEEEYMSNDDRILATAVALSKTMCRETSKDEKCFIQTELVLITTDRNLRVKALSRNLAVSELDEFLLWAKESNHT